jgi:transposase
MLTNEAENYIENIIIEKLQKLAGTRGRPPHQFFKAVKGIIFILRTGISLRKIPKFYGPRSTIFYWLKKAAAAGIFENLHQELLKQAITNDKLDLTAFSSDCSLVKAPRGGEKASHNPFDRHKYGTKRSIIIDGQGIVVSAVLIKAHRHDITAFDKTLKKVNPKIREKRISMHLDKGYDSHRAEAIIFSYSNFIPCISRKKTSIKKGKKDLCNHRKRAVVERTFAWLNQFRALYVCWYRSENIYLGLIMLASAIMIAKIL